MSTDRFVIKTTQQRINKASILIRQAFQALGEKDNLEIFALVFNRDKPSDEIDFVANGSLIGMNFMINMLLDQMHLPISAVSAIRATVSEAVELKGLEHMEAHFKGVNVPMREEHASRLAMLRDKYPILEQPDINGTRSGEEEQVPGEGTQAVDDVLQPVHEADSVPTQEHDHALGDGGGVDAHASAGFDSAPSDGGGAGSAGE